MLLNIIGIIASFTGIIWIMIGLPLAIIFGILYIREKNKKTKLRYRNCLLIALLFHPVIMAIELLFVLISK